HRWCHIAPPPPLTPPHKGEGNRPRRGEPLCTHSTGAGQRLRGMNMIKRILAALGIARLAPSAPAQNFGPPELIAAAKQEGRLIYYTANFAEVEQEVIKAFNKRFPGIRVEMVRAPGGQLITRVKTEAAAGKLVADVVDHSDRALMS